MEMPGRKFDAGVSYRYGFNGKENDNEVKGAGNQQDYGLRIYDQRLGRFLSVDPLYKKFPYWSSYQFSGNNPIRFIDLDGAEILDPLTRWFTTDAALTITTKPTSAKAKVYGTLLGVGNSVQGAVQGTAGLITHPIQSLKGIGRVLTQTPAQNVADYTINMVQTYGDLPVPVQSYAVGGHFLTDLGMTAAPFKSPIKASGIKFSAELPPGTQVAGVSIGKKLARTTYAQKVFANAGKSLKNIENLMNTIDFNKPVKETVLNPGDKIWRFEKTNSNGEIINTGDKHFFTDAYGADAGPTGVGFRDASGYKLVTYEVTEKTAVMESTIRGTKNKQYFSTELQNRLKKVAVE
jgi:RHS repeat-associated protein